MFWGLIMEPKRRYTQVVKRPFHISMAALDIFSADDEPTQVMLFFEERNYLLCTLHKGQMLQCPLDLNFETGDEVVFATNGDSNIHLSGYIQDQLDDFMDEGEEEEEEDEEEEVEVGKSTKSRKKKHKENDGKQPPTKKSKLAELLHEDYDSNDDDESFVITEALDDQDDEDEDEDGEDEVDEEEVSSLSGEEEDEDDEEDEDEQEEVEKPVKQMNGDRKEKSKKKKQQNVARSEASPKNEKKSKPEKTPVKTSKETQQKNVKNQKTESPAQQRKTLEGGVIIQDLKVGEGNLAKPGRMVQVHYEGRLKQNNKLFDQSNKGAGFKFRLGKQEVIKGWDVGVAGMKIGGRRRIICPPSMAYGQKGSPPAIPPNATLVFEVELKNVI